MTTFNIGGLVSGIDTNSLIDQLMTAAAAPQTAEENQLAQLQGMDGLYQSLNTKMTAIGTAVTALTDPDTWHATTVTSSDSSIVATGSATAQPGSFTSFNVNKIATAQVSTLVVTGATAADPTQGIDVVGADGTTHHINLTDGTAGSVAAAVNSAGVGVRAALISTDGGQVLQFTSTTTGAAAGFQINGLTANGVATQPTNLVPAQDAQIQVGDLANGGYTVSSKTNTFTDAIPGVTFTVSQPTTAPVTLSVASDEQSISDSVKAMVDAVNSALSEIGSDTAKGGALEGSSELLSMQQSMLSAISLGTATGGSYSTYGISITSTGQLTFDADAFATAYGNDPAGTQTAIQGSLAPTFNTVVTEATDPGTGSLTGLLSSDSDQEKTLQTSIDDWTTRLADQKTALQTKFAAMESALSQMKSESAYLSSMFDAASAQTTTSSSSSSSSSS